MQLIHTEEVASHPAHPARSLSALCTPIAPQDLVFSAIAGILVMTQLDILIGLTVFTGFFLAIAGVIGRMERPPPMGMLDAATP